MAKDPRATNPAVIGGIAVAAIGLGVFVFRPHPPAGATEWTPADHDPPPAQPAQPGQAAQPPQQPQAAQTAPSGAALAELAWARSCATCHGEGGRGDGPQGPMVRAPDLTRGDWQGRVTDDDIRHTILTGKNSMPKFDLPASVVDGLVKRIRSRRAR
jgi:cytochrome c oxidase cbb3-type subunit 3